MIYYFFNDAYKKIRLRFYSLAFATLLSQEKSGHRDWSILYSKEDEHFEHQKFPKFPNKQLRFGCRSPELPRAGSHG